MTETKTIVRKLNDLAGILSRIHQERWDDRSERDAVISGLQSWPAVLRDIAGVVKQAGAESPWDIARRKRAGGDYSWLPVSDDFHDEMLGAVPPIWIDLKWWGVGEVNHHTPEGEAVYLFFRNDVGGPVCRMATRREIKAEKAILDAAAV